MSEEVSFGPFNETRVIAKLVELTQRTGIPSRARGPADLFGVIMPALVATPLSKEITDRHIVTQLGYKSRSNIGSSVQPIVDAGLGRANQVKRKKGRPAQEVKITRSGISFLAGYNAMRERLVADRLKDFGCGSYSESRVAVSALLTFVASDELSPNPILRPEDIQDFQAAVGADDGPNWDVASVVLSRSLAAQERRPNVADDASALGARAVLESVRHAALDQFVQHPSLPFLGSWLENTMRHMVDAQITMSQG